MTEYGFPVFTLCSVVLDLLPLTQDVSGTQGFDNQIKAALKSFELKVKLQVFIQDKCTD